MSDFISRALAMTGKPYTLGEVSLAPFDCSHLAEWAADEIGRS